MRSRGKPGEWQSYSLRSENERRSSTLWGVGETVGIALGTLRQRFVPNSQWGCHVREQLAGEIPLERQGHMTRMRYNIGHWRGGDCLGRQCSKWKQEPLEQLSAEL